MCMYWQYEVSYYNTFPLTSRLSSPPLGFIVLLDLSLYIPLDSVLILFFGVAIFSS